jgi:hypothetical protein
MARKAIFETFRTALAELSTNGMIPFEVDLVIYKWIRRIEDHALAQCWE